MSALIDNVRRDIRQSIGSQRNMLDHLETIEQFHLSGALALDIAEQLDKWLQTSATHALVAEIRRHAV